MGSSTGRYSLHAISAKLTNTLSISSFSNLFPSSVKTVQAAPMNDPTSLHSMAAAEGAKVPAVRRPEPRKHLHCVEVETRGEKWRGGETSGDKWRLGAAVITLRY